MENKFVSIIIPTYNREKEILACLRSLDNIKYTHYEIIVVDNNSSDNSGKYVKKQFPHVKLIELKNNLGAIGGRNEGIKHARGEYLCFVDSDNILDENFLSELVKLADSNRTIGFLGPKMYYYCDPKRLWYAGVDVSLYTSKTKYIGINEADIGQYDQIREVHHIPNVWMVKRDVILKIGGMNQEYVMTYGEAEWAMRAKMAGYKIMFCPTSIVYHNIPLPDKTRSLRGLIGFDNPYRIYYASRNRILFMKNFANKFWYIVFLIIFNNLFLIRYCLILLRFKRMDLTKSYIKGYIDGLLK